MSAVSPTATMTVSQRIVSSEFGIVRVVGRPRAVGGAEFGPLDHQPLDPMGAEDPDRGSVVEELHALGAAAIDLLAARRHLGSALSVDDRHRARLGEPERGPGGVQGDVTASDHHHGPVLPAEDAPRGPGSRPGGTAGQW